MSGLIDIHCPNFWNVHPADSKASTREFTHFVLPCTKSFQQSCA